MLLTVIGILLFLIVAICVVIFIRSKKDEVNEYYEAAESILKEEKLNETIKNPYKHGEASVGISVIKPMIYIKSKVKKDCKYVFDPERGVYIGRDKSTNHICINEAIVSQKHCLIYASGLHVFIMDLNSANGVEIRRGGRRFIVSCGQVAELCNGDTLIIGTTELKVVLFNYNMMLM